MRLFNTSERELPSFGVEESVIAKYQQVRKILTKADIPPSKRKVADGGQQLPAGSFDPIIKDAVKHWTSMFFLSGVSWADIDDDKIASCSPMFKQYGMKMTPTKDKKLKPVFHVMALIGAGFISYIHPDTRNLKLGEMLTTAIKHVAPSEHQLPTLAFFIDRGYLELCQAQSVKITNLIQIMELHGVKFLGTSKDSESFPFKIVDLNDSSSTTVVNGRPIIQGYGTRTSFTAKSDNKTAVVMKHGGGKIRVARGVTNLVECRQDTWAYETNGDMRRKPHATAPPPLHQNANINQQIDHAWKVWMSGIIILTLLQRTAD